MKAVQEVRAKIARCNSGYKSQNSTPEEQVHTGT
ncbi:hypothetical protein L914_12373 [Phytophthora nicotianae]|uniref:Uncharacterized protein n=1 Tax=Phytophthora nicotianae TaxID=4792 RepID=W2N2F5_PHYNI|nr:hypothetical protein L914_12373 [Phytophthora nicotianae]